MEPYTKKKINGIFVLGLELKGYSRTEARSMVSLRPYLTERVLAVQTSFITMFDGVDAAIIEHFRTTNNLKKLLGRVIEKELETIC